MYHNTWLIATRRHLKTKTFYYFILKTRYTKGRYNNFFKNVTVGFPSTLFCSLRYVIINKYLSVKKLKVYTNKVYEWNGSLQYLYWKNKIIYTHTFIFEPYPPGEYWIYCFIQSKDKYSHVYSYTTAKRLIFKILSCMRDYFQDISSLLCMRF